jgi:hypothetical protein
MSRHTPLIATAIAVALAIPAACAVLRAYAVLLGPPEPDPATVVWTVHIAMFWRLAVSLYIAGMLAPLAYLAAKRNLPRTMRVLATSVLVVAAMVGVQGVLLP